MNKLITLFLLITLIGCDVSDIPKNPNRITIAVSSDITTLDPVTTMLMQNYIVADLAYERLISFEVKDGLPTGKFSPELASSWNRSPNGLVWTFNLNPNHHFDNGTEVTSEAVKFTFDRAKGIGMSPGQALFWLQKVNAIDKYTVEFHLNQPLPFFLSMMALVPSSIVNPDIMRHEIDGDFGSKWLSENSAGSGPYKVRSFTRRQQVNLEINPYSTIKAAYFSEVILNVVKDTTSQLIQIEKGDADIIDPVAHESLAWLKGKRGISLLKGPSPIVQLLHMNNEKYPFHDIRVRKAISLGIDRQNIIDSIYKGRASIISGAIPNGIPGFDPNIDKPDYNPKKAKALLSEAGIPENLPLTITVISNGSVPPSALALQSYLIDMGFDTSIEQIAPSARGKILKGDFDMTIQAISMDFPDPWIIFNFAFNSETIGYGNFSRYRNIEVDQIIKKADSILDHSDRIEQYRIAHKMVMNDNPTIILYQVDRTIAFQKNIKGLLYNFSQPLTYNVEDLRRVSISNMEKNQ